MKKTHLMTAVGIVAMHITSANMALALENQDPVPPANITEVRETLIIAKATTAGYTIRNRDLHQALSQHLRDNGLSIGDVKIEALTDRFISNRDFRAGLQNIVVEHSSAVKQEFSSLKNWVRENGYPNVADQLSLAATDPSFTMFAGMMKDRVRNTLNQTESDPSTSSTTVPNTTAGAARDAVPAE